jgi:hypothetical protein
MLAAEMMHAACNNSIREKTIKKRKNECSRAS